MPGQYFGWPRPEYDFKETRVLSREVTEAAGIRYRLLSAHWDLSGVGGVSSLYPSHPQPCLLPQHRSSDGWGCLEPRCLVSETVCGSCRGPEREPRGRTG